jgi:hypothetical protein
MRKWTRRILIALLIVIVLAIAITQIVLWTDFPRTLVIRLVQQQLGLRVEAKSLSTGWFGSTTLNDVKVSLPLADESFLSMPTMEVDHTALIPLLRGATDAIAHSGPARAMAGSVARGDFETVERHLAALGKLDPQMRDLYRLLALRTLPLAVKAGLDPAREARIRDLLKGSA